MKRYVYAALGILFVVIGAVGIWLPLVPTAVPLMLASFFFAKSFPALEERLIRNKLFAKFHCYLDGSVEMPLKTRLTTIGTMWISITISGLVLWYGGSPDWLLIVLVVLGLIGSVVIFRYGKRKDGTDKSLDEHRVQTKRESGGITKRSNNELNPSNTKSRNCSDTE